MSRAVKEWIGVKDDTAPPPSVRLRIFERYGGVCQCGCTRKIAAGEKWQVDHGMALINGGKNRENNMRPLLTAHHKQKTKADVAEKSAVFESRKRHLGLKVSKHPLPGSRASGIRRRMNGRVERW